MVGDSVEGNGFAVNQPFVRGTLYGTRPAMILIK
jgi:hypothetical protein